jgi:hypothetical protein
MDWKSIDHFDGAKKGLHTRNLCRFYESLMEGLAAAPGSWTCQHIQESGTDSKTFNQTLLESTRILSTYMKHDITLHLKTWDERAFHKCQKVGTDMPTLAFMKSCHTTTHSKYYECIMKQNDQHDERSAAVVVVVVVVDVNVNVKSLPKCSWT